MATQTLTTQNQYELLRPVLNERQWRIYLGTQARKLGRGGITWVAKPSGGYPSTIARCIPDSPNSPFPDCRVRLPPPRLTKFLAPHPTLTPPPHPPPDP